MGRTKSRLTDAANRGTRKARVARDAVRDKLRLSTAEYKAEQPLKRATGGTFVSQLRVARTIKLPATVAPAIFVDRVGTLRPQPGPQPLHKTPGTLAGAPLVCGTCELLLEDGTFVARLLAPGGPCKELRFNASAHVPAVHAFLKVASHSHTEDTRFPPGARKAGFGLRWCKEHQRLCGLGWYTHCALHPRETEALFPLAQEVWAIFKALYPAQAVDFEAYAAELLRRGLHVIPNTAFSHMFLADKQAFFHVDEHTSTPARPMLDMVATMHDNPGTARGGDLVLALPDGTRLALKMEHGTIAMINAKEHAHASTRLCAPDGDCSRLVASLFCEPRLLEHAAKRRSECAFRFATWPPARHEVDEYKRSAAYRNSAYGKAERAPEELRKAQARLTGAQANMAAAAEAQRRHRATKDARAAAAASKALSAASKSARFWLARVDSWRQRIV